MIWSAARELKHVSIFYMHYEKQSYTVQAVFPVYKNGLVLQFTIIQAIIQATIIQAINPSRKRVK